MSVIVFVRLGLSGIDVRLADSAGWLDDRRCVIPVFDLYGTAMTGSWLEWQTPGHRTDTDRRSYSSRKKGNKVWPQG